MTNDAAERLRIKLFNEFDASLVLEYDQALAAERRATVERIRAAIDEWAEQGAVTIVEFRAILDAEADR